MENRHPIWDEIYQLRTTEYPIQLSIFLQKLIKMAKFTADSSIEPQILDYLEQHGHTCETHDGDPKDIVGYAQTGGSVVVTRKTEYSALLAPLKNDCPCMVWVGLLPDSPAMAEQWGQILEAESDHLKKGQVVMMMPGRNRILPVG
jgi:predicted nuclease of predicted toxin-antitoxin system